jgi:hypothetical protein
MNSQSSRKTGHGDSDEEEQSSANGRSTMDIYRLRRQKRVKLTTTSADLVTPPVLT